MLPRLMPADDTPRYATCRLRRCRRDYRLDAAMPLLLCMLISCRYLRHDAATPCRQSATLRHHAFSFRHAMPRCRHRLPLRAAAAMRYATRQTLRRCRCRCHAGYAAAEVDAAVFA